MKPQKHKLTYLKLPDYMIPLVFKRFGNPVQFDEGSRIQSMFNSSLICIKDMERHYSRISCSQHAFDISVAKKRGQLTEDEFVGTPSGKDIDSFVPVVMPLYIMVKDENDMMVSVPITDFHTLTLDAAQKIRKLIRQIFWTDFSQFHKAYADREMKGVSPTHKNKTFKFLEVQDISDDMFETVCRTETRLIYDMQ